jgi:hypothetical protein
MRRNLELSEKAKTIQYECAPAFLEFRCAFSESAMKIVLLGGLTRVFGGIDASLMLYDRALADKATAAGARLGTVLAPAATGIAYEDASGSPYLGKNCASVPGVCTSATAVCVAGDCGTDYGYSAASFTAVVQAMQRMAPQITSSNVQVTYVRRDDAGYVGQTSRPLTIEVSLQGLSYRWTFLPFSPAPLRSTTATVTAGGG